MTVRTVHVAKSDLTAAQIVDTPPGPLADGALRLRVETFAVTANNVTYALFGDQMAYWNFFPAPEGFGIVPMWGHAVVEVSNVDGIAAGERVYGYLPMGTHLDVLPGKVSRGGFTDMAPHRQPMSPIYNQYSRLAADPEHAPDKEAERMIFGPLFKTGFLIESFMRREGWFGAQALIMTSASSKTAMGLASVARARSPEIERVGLTSTANANFVADSGMYDRVLAYEDIGELPDVPSVSVDFAGNAAVLRAVHERLGARLAYSCLVGATHVDARGGGASSPLPGPAPILFFAPDHAVAAIAELGPRGFGDAIAESWATFLHDIGDTLAVDERAGLASAAAAFVETFMGSADPAKGIVIRP